MVQKSQFIDLKKSYVPIDPNSFPEVLVNTDREDTEEKVLPVLAYEGYNFIPTPYGYRSYFGTTKKLGLGILASRCQHIVTYKTTSDTYYLIALAEDGIWVNTVEAGGSWTQLVTHTFNGNVFERWTFCVIQNILYMYKQGKDEVYYTNITEAGVFEINNFIPTFLNMAGQMGIFRAGVRLGFWDSSNSISWSSAFALSDFEPSLETLAGNSIFAECIGRIVTIISNADAFTVYCTGSIVGAIFIPEANLVWDAKKILDAGIQHPYSVTTANTDYDHYAWTTAGLLHIKKYNPFSKIYETEFILPEFYDFMKEERKPIYMSCTQDRYLTFRIFDTKYLFGRASTTTQYVDPSKTALLLGEEYWDGDITVLPTNISDGSMATIIAQWNAQNFPSNADSGLCADLED